MKRQKSKKYKFGVSETIARYKSKNSNQLFQKKPIAEVVTKLPEYMREFSSLDSRMTKNKPIQAEDVSVPKSANRTYQPKVAPSSRLSNRLRKKISQREQDTIDGDEIVRPPPDITTNQPSTSTPKPTEALPQPTITKPSEEPEKKTEAPQPITNNKRKPIGYAKRAAMGVSRGVAATTRYAGDVISRTALESVPFFGGAIASVVSPVTNSIANVFDKIGGVKKTQQSGEPTTAKNFYRKFDGFTKSVIISLANIDKNTARAVSKNVAFGKPIYGAGRVVGKGVVGASRMIYRGTKGVLDAFKANPIPQSPFDTGQAQGNPQQPTPLVGDESSSFIKSTLAGGVGLGIGSALSSAKAGIVGAVEAGAGLVVGGAKTIGQGVVGVGKEVISRTGAAASKLGEIGKKGASSLLSKTKELKILGPILKTAMKTPVGKAVMSGLMLAASVGMMKSDMTDSFRDSMKEDAGIVGVGADILPNVDKQVEQIKKDNEKLKDAPWYTRIFGVGKDEYLASLDKQGEMVRADTKVSLSNFGSSALDLPKPFSMSEELSNIGVKNQESFRKTNNDAMSSIFAPITNNNNSVTNTTNPVSIRVDARNPESTFSRFIAEKYKSS
jgi:hypothetical protein